MPRRICVQVVEHALGNRQLRGRPAHPALREPVALPIRALLKRATVHRALVALEVPCLDLPLALGVGEVVELLQGPPELAGDA